MSDNLANKQYLEKKLNLLIERGLVNNFSISNKGHTTILLESADTKVTIITDLQDTMEIVINGYFRELTDYRVGDFKETIDWYIQILESIYSKKYSLVRYTRGRKEICRYLLLKVNNKDLRLGDYKNHFKLFAKKEEILAGSLSGSAE